MSDSHPIHVRKYDRTPVDGAAYWSEGRDEGACRLHTLSPGGAGIDGRCSLSEGAVASVTLSFGGILVEAVTAEVVWVGIGQLGLKFHRVTHEQQTQIEEILTEAAQKPTG